MPKNLLRKPALIQRIILPPRDQRRSKKQQNAGSVSWGCIKGISVYIRLYPHISLRGSLGSAGLGGEGSGLGVSKRRARALVRYMKAGMVDAGCWEYM